MTDPNSGLDNLACLFWDTPLSDIVSGLNAVKGVLDHSLITSPISKSTLYLVNAKLADFKAVFSHLGTVESPRLSTAPAMERVKAIEMLKDNWRNLSASQGVGTSLSSASGGISANSYATAGYHATPYMTQMESFPVDEKGQESLLALAIQARLPFFVRAMINKPSQPQINAFRTLGKLHSVAQTHLTSYIARMILVGFNQLDSPGLLLQLIAALDQATLVSMLEGNFPEVTKLLDMYGQFRSLIAGARQPTLNVQSISVDLHEFEKFITFLQVLLTSLGFDAQALPELVRHAKDLAFISQSNVAQVLETTLVQSLKQTLKAFGVSVRAWLHAMDNTAPLPLAVKNDVVLEAIEGTRQFNKMNYFRHGIPTFAAPPAHHEASSSSQSRTRDVPRSARPSGASANSSPNKRAKTKGTFSQGTYATPPGLVQQACSVGEVVQWGAFFNATAAKQKFSSLNPTIVVQDSYLPCMLAKLNTPERCMSYIPQGTPDDAISALRAWYNAGRGKAFKINRPSDFR